MSPELECALGQALGQVLEVQNVQFHKSENKIVARFRSERLLDAQQMASVKESLQRLIPESAVEAKFVFPEAGQLLKNSFEQCKAVLSATWCELMPFARPYIAGSEWDLEDGALLVRVPGGAPKQLTGEQSVSEIERAFSSLYGFSLKLKVCPSEELSVAADSQEPPALPAASPKAPAPFSAKAKEPRAAGPSKPREGIRSADVLYGRAIKKADIVAMETLREDSGRVTVRGAITSIESRPIRGGANKELMLFAVTDYTNTMPVKLFLEAQESAKFMERLEQIRKTGDHLCVRGDCYIDQYSRELCILPLDINCFCPPKRLDTGEEKRVELHLHTQLSAMDGLTKVSDAVNTAAKWGHRAIAITDHGVVQAFPEAAKTAKKAGIHLIYGVEGYLIPDVELRRFETIRPVAIAVKTIANSTGMRYITQIAAAKHGEDGRIERYFTLVNPGCVHSDDEGNDTEAYQNAPLIQDALEELFAFAGDGVLTSCDPEGVEVLFEYLDRYRMERKSEFIDLAMLAHHLAPLNKELSFDDLFARYEIDPPGTSAKAQADATLPLFERIHREVKAHGSEHLPISSPDFEANDKGRGHRARHIIILAKTQEGLKNLYRLVSFAHIEYFHKVPRIPKSLLELYREGLILGSACEAGELFRAVLDGKDEEELLRIADWYDYLEIQPIGNNAFLMRNDTVRDEEGLRDLNRRIVELGATLNKPVVATGDVHFLEPHDAKYRAILMHYMGFEDADNQAPLYFKTTDEMLEEFSYLGPEKAREVVIESPCAIAASCEELKPYPDGTYAPKIEGAEENLKNLALTRAHELYGEELPPAVQARLDKELNSIITNGFASLYMMAQQLVKKSLDDGYLVGSRGSVGSSLVATFAGITEVNPLPPHYVCPKCNYSDFDVERTKSSCGVDMQGRVCPRCGTRFNKEGYDIPFEVFLGFHGDKTPDIDLNFSGDYQPVAHQFTETMFGEGHAFRAGTIGAVKDKTVFGYVKNYCEKKGVTMSRAEMERIALGCSGVKRTTGQHPGGIVVLPKDRDIHEFTPVQYPADQKDKNTITTHFDFHALDDRLVKLDILGHDDPTALRMLRDLTNFDPLNIPLDDEPTMGIYSSIEPLGISLEAIDCDVGTLGIPEFGTHFVRGMLKETRPTTMEELVRIAGLSHGTDVWLNNAQLLVQSGTATLSEVICTRDDIMNYLIAKGGEASISFKTMENVRKGKGLTPQMEEAMRAIRVPEWFVDSCKKIKYMFPRAHAVAYVMMSFRVAYYKVHYPLAYYAVYYTVRADAFDYARACGGAKKVLENIRQIEKMGKNASALEKDQLIILEVVYEMNLRGIELLPVDLYRSHATRFLIEDGAIRPPLSSIAGVGENAAVAISEEAQFGPFRSMEDLRVRAKANSAVMGALEQMGCLEGLAATNQVSMF
ncbi:MAG: PolC-type DNA polymerase III [Bacillota bacterium]